MNGSVARSGSSFPHVQLVMIVVAIVYSLLLFAIECVCAHVRWHVLFLLHVVPGTRRSVVFNRNEHVTGEPDPCPDAVPRLRSIRADLEHLTGRERSQPLRDQRFQTAAAEAIGLENVGNRRCSRLLPCCRRWGVARHVHRTASFTASSEILLTP